MRTLLAFLFLVSLVSCGETSGGKSGGNNSGGSGGAESGHDYDFDAMSAHCYEVHETYRRAQYECCLEQAVWQPFDEESCYDFQADPSYLEGTAGDPDLYCSASEIQDSYGSYTERGFSEDCVEAGLNIWADVFECRIDAYAGGCQNESALGIVDELLTDCAESGPLPRFQAAVSNGDCE